MVPVEALNAKMPDRVISVDVAVCEHAGEVPADDHHVADLRDVVHRAVPHVWGPRGRRGRDHAVMGVEGDHGRRPIDRAVAFSARCRWTGTDRRRARDDGDPRQQSRHQPHRTQMRANATAFPMRPRRHNRPISSFRLPCGAEYHGSRGTATTSEVVLVEPVHDAIWRAARGFATDAAVRPAPRGRARSDQTACTRVPTRRPSRIARKLPGSDMSNTTIGMLFSRQNAMAVASMTRRSFVITSV